jgi:hypothetical protein
MRGVLQRPLTRGSSDATHIPPSVHDVLRSPGRPLDGATRAFFEPRFGQDFSSVRVHTGPRAAESARAVNAIAYTVGQDIVFGSGWFAPASASGKRLLAHELAHCVQQKHSVGSPDSGLSIERAGSPSEREADRAAQVVGEGGALGVQQRSYGKLAKAEGEPRTEGFYARTKRRAYQAIIAGMRTNQRVLLGLIRRAGRALPAKLGEAVETVLGIVEFITDLVISYHLAILSIAVGLVEGVVDMVVGVFKLAAGLLTGILLLLQGIFTWDWEPAWLWLKDLGAALAGLPGAIKALFENWIAEFKVASTDRQTIMIGELTGQILALLVPFTWAGKAGSAGRISAAARLGGEGSRGAAAGGELVDLAAVRAARAAEVTETTAPAGRGASALRTSGSTALKPAPVEVPVLRGPRPLPAEAPPAPVIPLRIPPRTPPASPPASVWARRAAIGAGVGASKAENIAAGPVPAAGPATQEKPRRRKPRAYPILWPWVFGPPMLFGVSITNFVRTPNVERDESYSWEVRRELWARHRGTDPDLMPRDWHAHHVVPLFLGGLEGARGNITFLPGRLHLSGHGQLASQPQMETPPPPLRPLPRNILRHPVGTEYELVGFK